MRMGCSSPAYGAGLEKNLENEGAKEAEFWLRKGLEAEIDLLLKRICLHAIVVLNLSVRLPLPVAGSVQRPYFGGLGFMQRIGGREEMGLSGRDWALMACGPPFLLD